MKIENQDIKDKIVEDCLEDVVFEGWNENTIKNSFKKNDINNEMFYDYFPRGVEDVILHFINLSDRKMVKTYNELKVKPKKTPEKIKTMLLIRFRQHNSHKECIRRASRMLILNQNIFLSSKSLYSTIDLIWRTCEDNSTDFSFYTKRVSLSMLYISVFISWLNDYENNLDETENFIDRRLADVAFFGKYSSSFKNNLNNVFSNFQNFGFNNSKY